MINFNLEIIELYESHIKKLEKEWDHLLQIPDLENKVKVLKAEIYEEINKKNRHKNKPIVTTRKDTHEYWFYDWSSWKPIFKRYWDLTEVQIEDQVEIWFERNWNK